MLFEPNAALAPTTVLLVDDHAVVRTGYRRLLEAAPNVAVIGEAASGEDAVTAYFACRPSVVVMDISLPGIGGIEAARRILSVDPAARILMFSIHEEVQFSTRALEIGALGYVTKSSAPETLVDAVRVVAGRKHYISHDIAQQMAVAGAPGTTPIGLLSSREFEVLNLLVSGKSVAEIASLLALSPKTVANHQFSIRRKLEADSPAKLLRIAYAHGIVPKYWHDDKPL